MQNIKHVWIYTRFHGSADQIMRQQLTLGLNVRGTDFAVVGRSSDPADTPMPLRQGLRQALRAVRSGAADALLTATPENISHSNRRLRRVLNRLQDSGAVLLCVDCDLGYDLYLRGLEYPLRSRAARKGLGLPWC